MADPPLRSSYGLHQPYALRNVIELENEDGIIGIAETYGGDQPAAALETIREQVVGACPYRLTGDLMLMVEGGSSGLERSQTYNVPGENPLDADARTYSAIETACLDLIGKSVGKPVCDLIGGRVRDRVSFSAYPFYKHAGGGGEGDDSRDDEYGEALGPESLVGQVQQMREQYGFGSIKFKGGVLEPEIEVETIRQLRQALGQAVPLRIDPNCAWSVDTSVKVGQNLAEELSMGGYLEDPCVGIDGMGEVRRRLLADGIETPLASNVAVTSFGDIPEAVRQDAVQVILCDHHYWGGMRQIQQLARVCKTFGIGLSMHSNSHLGISLAAMAHLGAAVPNLTYALDTHYPWQADEVILGGHLPFVDGCIHISREPGLGVELDREALAELHACFLACGLKDRNDEIEMQKVEPGWTFKSTRW